MKNRTISEGKVDTGSSLVLKDVIFPGRKGNGD